MNKLIVICMFFLYVVITGVSTAGSLSNNGNGTVVDSGTRLIWQQGESSLMTWEAALLYCEGLSLANYTDWRLPNHKELLSIVDDTSANPAINTTLFPGASSSFYWSSTTSAASNSNVWYVSFGNGVSSVYNKTDEHYARCVRDGH